MKKRLTEEEWKKVYESYDEVGKFSFGLAPVRKNDKWGYIDDAGKEIIPCQYEVVRKCDGTGWLEVKRNGSWDTIDDSTLYDRTHNNQKIIPDKLL
jgi:hypothetical protein